MKKNKITIIINKSIDDVFEFTTNPINTHLWIPSIKKEICEEYPPKIGTKYKNCGDDENWDEYKVSNYIHNKEFELQDLEKNYVVKYSYKSLETNKTEMEYYEWVNEGELENPFTNEIILNLKKVMEKLSK